MELEQQVCSLELAKRLKELGVKQESLFYWERHIFEPERPWKEWTVVFRLNVPDKEFNHADNTYISAFTVAELGEMLPWPNYSGQFVPETRGYIVKNDELPTNFRADTEADARAKMLVHLIENKSVSA